MRDLHNIKFEDLPNQEKRKLRLQRAKEKATHTKKQWHEMLVFFDHTCVRCEGESGLVNVEKDHITPIYQGGSDSIKNLQPLCAKCNASKGPESKDWRLEYCKKHNMEMPDEWKKSGTA